MPPHGYPPYGYHPVHHAPTGGDRQAPHSMYMHPYHYKGMYTPYHHGSAPYMYPPYYPGPPPPFGPTATAHYHPNQPSLHYPPALEQQLLAMHQTNSTAEKNETSNYQHKESSQIIRSGKTISELKPSSATALLSTVSPSLPPEKPTSMKTNFDSNSDDQDDDMKKPMTREQFYKIRPKLPRIAKGDPRRSYAAAFAEAYNSCDFEKIWEFVSTYCTKDVLFIHRWVGSESYLNFPKYLEVRGIESVSEYWFSRCMIAPDMVLEMKETKLYVRSDGISTVLSSLTFVCTRLYDGEISDSIICRPAVDPDLLAESSATEAAQSNQGNPPSTNAATASGYLSSHSVDYDSDNKSLKSATKSDVDDSKPEEICNRVLEKMELILSKVEPPPKKRIVGIKRKQGEETADGDIKSCAEQNSVTSAETTESEALVNGRKRLPKYTSITVLGTVTLHLNQEHKIRTIELNFALQSDPLKPQQ